jgi:hypothetical protein
MYCFTRLAHFSALLSREMDEPPAVHRLNGHDFAVLGPPMMMASFRKKFVYFVQNWHI